MLIATLSTVIYFLQLINESLRRREGVRDYLAQLMQKQEDDEKASLEKAAAEKEAM
jgi:hypothetical protein